MSGTSLDGLDLCAAELVRSNGRWQYRILAFETVSYRETPWPERLTEAYHIRGRIRNQTSLDFAAWCQAQWADFDRRHHFGAQAVAHHGHTVEHDPAHGITVQIGHEPSVFATSPIPVVGDFRSASVARGGQGAPLVPLADRDLFGDYAVCVNLGGFSNASWTDAGGLRRAGDLGPCNGLLNPLAQELGLDYDPEGRYAASGQVNYANPAHAAPSNQPTSQLANQPTSQLANQPTSQLANQPTSQLANQQRAPRASQLAYYAAPFPKSLGREWMDREFWPAFNAFRPQKSEDALATAADHIAWSIAHGLRTAQAPQGPALLSGGGAYNTDLIRRITEYAPEWTWTVAEKQTLEAKEALAFAYLGLLRLRNEPNVLASYAGGRSDGCDGTIFGTSEQNLT
ncbi:MAG: anhydro-N-acetylmuramic acid kinase [Bacteroidota bacterium]